MKIKKILLKNQKSPPPSHSCIRNERVIQNVISKVEEEQSTPYVIITESHQDDICKSYSLTPHKRVNIGKKRFVTLPKK